MLDSGRLVPHDVFTFTHYGDAVPPIAWLAQLGYAALFRIGGWRGLQVISGLVFGAALVVAAWPLRRSGVSLFSAAAAMVLALLVVLPHSSVRPQAFGTLGFAVLLTLLQSDLPWHKLVCFAAPVLLLWQNAHPSLAVGAVAAAPLVAGRWLEYYRDRTRDRPAGPTLVLLLTILCMFATPLGAGIMPVTQTNAAIARDWLGVTEWLPPWDPSVRGAMLTFWLALILSLVLLFRLRFRVPLADLSEFVVMTSLALSAARFGLFWAVALVPVWGRWIEQAKPGDLFAWRAEGTVGRRLAFMSILAATAAVWAVPTVARAPLFSAELPVEGVARLRDAFPAGRIYNYREWGGPLIFAGSPNWQVAIDGRLYLFSFEEWQSYNGASRGTMPLAAIVREYRPDAFFLRPSFHEALIAELRQAPDWHELYSDSSCSIFLKRPTAVSGGVS